MCTNVNRALHHGKLPGKPASLTLSVYVYLYEQHGWAVWTTAAVDRRVIAQIPMVMPAEPLREVRFII